MMNNDVLCAACVCVFSLNITCKCMYVCACDVQMCVVHCVYCPEYLCSC